MGVLNRLYNMQLKRQGYTIKGRVQGVGFRPFVYCTATKLGLTGKVKNTIYGVWIEVQGDDSKLNIFKEMITNKKPSIAQFTSITIQSLGFQDKETEFLIEESSDGIQYTSLISPDIATCEYCVKELNTTTDHRYQYPFISCTLCGPRYTIIHKAPYDRHHTSMSSFPFCFTCEKEYNNSLDRRFHAQSNACPTCGPQLWLTDHDNRYITYNSEAILLAIEYIYKGKIIAMKGIGGFHLICDATNADVVNTLRYRKNRPDKPLAVMVPNINIARQIAYISEVEIQKMQSPECPIVILKAIPHSLPKNIAPDVSTIGLMLPYTPLHHILCNTLTKVAELERIIPALVMTSANVSGGTIIYNNDDALIRLNTIADFFLFHNRNIIVPVDDSVVCLREDNIGQSPNWHFIRRARGYAPLPITVKTLKDNTPCIIALGAEHKSTFCFTRGQDIFLSQHIGDLSEPETEWSFCQTVKHISQLFGFSPEVVVCDLHPDYFTTRYAAEFGLPILQLQHHIAHGYSVLAEHEHKEPALVLTLDGTGYGMDGTIWGGELFYLYPEAVKGKSYEQGERLARLSLLPLPGGEKAIHEPWRLLSGFLALLKIHELEEVDSLVRQLWKNFPERWTIHSAIREMVSKDKVKLTSSCGRLFDTVSTLFGLCDYITYEGQAAIRLEHQQDMSCNESLTISIVEKDSIYELDTTVFLKELIELLQQKISVSILARRFHIGLVEGLADLALIGSENTGVKTVGLSGGVLNNQTISSLLPKALRYRGLTPLMHKNVPSGDGGISFGQAYWASMVLA